MTRKVILTFIGIVGFLLVVLASNLIDMPDLLVANTIPHYSNGTNWKINSSSGFPDGRPGADITFETGDSPEKVIDYYKGELLKKNWKMINGYKDIHKIKGSGFTNVGQRFKKNILGTDFYLTISKGETTRQDYQQFTKRVIIFVDRYQ